MESVNGFFFVFYMNGIYATSFVYILSIFMRMEYVNAFFIACLHEWNQ